MEAGRRRFGRGSPLAVPVIAACAALVAGCGGGGGSTPASPALPVTAPATPAATTAGATLQLTVPGSTAAQAARRAAAAVPQIKGFAVVVTPAGGTALPAQVVDVSPASPNCTAAASGGRTCTIPVSVPPGNASIAVTAYDGIPAAGKATGAVLSTATIAATIVTGQSTTIPLTLNSVVAAVKLSFLNNVQVGASGTVTVVVAAFDADGNQIVADAYANPLSISTTDSSGALSFNTATVKSPADVVTLSYNGALPPVTGYPIVVTASGLAAAAVTGTTYLPDNPRSTVGITNTYVQTQQSATVVVSPLPTPAFGTANDPVSSTPSPVPNQIVETRSTAGPTATVLGVTGAVRTFVHQVWANTASVYQTLVTDDTYGNAVTNGNRIDGLLFSNVHASTFTYSTGTSVQTNTNVYPPQGQIQYKTPLTNGDTWTASTQRIANFLYSDTRPVTVLGSGTQIAQNQTQTFNADGSVNTTDTESQAGGYTYGFTSVQKADGSVTTTATDGNGITEVDTIGPVTNGSASFTFTFSGAAIKTLTLSGTASGLPAAGPAWTDTASTAGPVALDTRCGLSAPTLAYATTETSTTSFTGQFRQTVVTTRYQQPGLGIVCEIFTTTTQNVGRAVNVQLFRTSGALYTNWGTFVPTGLVSTTTSSTVRTLQMQTQQALQRSPFSLTAVTLDVSTSPDIVRSAPHGGRPL